MVKENALDLKKKSLQRLLPAKEAAGRRVSAEVLQESANEKGKAEKQGSRRWPTAASGKRVEEKKNQAGQSQLRDSAEIKNPTCITLLREN